MKCLETPLQLLSSEAADRHFAGLKALYQTAPVGLGLLDRELRYVRVNDRLREFHGFPPSEIGRSAREVVPEIADALEPILRGVLETGRPVLNVEVHESTPEPPAERYWLANYYPVRAADGGEVVGVSVVVQDITDRKRKGLALDERARFERVLSEVAATLVNVGPAALDATLEAGLALLGEHLHLDRVYLLEFSEGAHGPLRVRHLWAAPGLPARPAERDLVVDEASPWLSEQVRRGEVIVVPSMQHLPEEAAAVRAYRPRLKIRSFVIAPLAAGGSLLGALALAALRAPRDWPPELVERLRLLGTIFANALARERDALRLQRTLDELRGLKDRLERENVYVRDEIRSALSQNGMVGSSQASKDVLRQIEQVAPTNSTVLLMGETGVGKELAARILHELSPRRDRPMVKVNCAALPSTLVESELFGREKGAYTGALSRSVGRFEVADGSTIFLDEVGELPLELQAKLLRVLQDGEFERLGSTKTVRVNARVVAASNRDLAQAVREGRFRDDLYYRLNVFPITIPSLRERREDIPPLVWWFVQALGEATGRTIEAVPRKTMEALQAYAWPGNVRELRNVIERALITTQGPTLHIEIPGQPACNGLGDTTLAGVQRRHIQSVLEGVGWRVRGPNGAAHLLGLKATTLEARMAKLGIRRGPGSGART